MNWSSAVLCSYKAPATARLGLQQHCHFCIQKKKYQNFHFLHLITDNNTSVKMKTFTIASIIALASLGSAQLDNIPSCAVGHPLDQT